MVNFNGITSTPTPHGDYVRLARKCPFCRKEHTITVKQDDVLSGMRALSAGNLVQDAFPNWAPDEREFLMTGICPKCWGNM